jgi:hypothetical protein
MLKRLLMLCGVLITLSACSGMADDVVIPTRINLVVDELPPQTDSIPPTLQPTHTPIGHVVGRLDFWVAQAGRLQSDVPDVWEFQATAGDEVIVRAVGLPAMLTLRTAEGRILQTETEIHAFLPETGLYTVSVQAAESGLTGSYQIGVGHANQPNPNIAQSTDIPVLVGVPTPLPIYAGLGAFIAQLAHNETIGGSITENLAPHVYTFDGYAGQYVALEMRGVGGDSIPRLTLYDPFGLPLATDSESGGERIAMIQNVRLPQDGLYTVQAASNVAGGYSVRLLQYDTFAITTPYPPEIITETPVPTYIGIPTPAFVSTGVQLLKNSLVMSVLDSPATVVIYALDLQAGEIITIGGGAIQGSPARLQFELRSPDGQVVASANSDSSNANGDTLISAFRAGTRGAYQLVVAPFQELSGGYMLGYGNGSTWLDVSMASPPFGERQDGILRRRGQRDVWPIQLRAGDIIALGVTPSGDSLLDPIVELVAADRPDDILATDDNSGGNRAALIQQITIPYDGTYLIRVRASASDPITDTFSQTGDYGLIWRYVNIAPTSTPPPSTFPVLTRRDSVPDSEYVFYPFYGREGQRIQVFVEALEGDGFDPVAALIAPNGRVLAEVDDSDGTLNPRFIFTLPAEGTYNIRVNGYLQGGTFRLTVDELFD